MINNHYEFLFLIECPVAFRMATPTQAIDVLLARGNQMPDAIFVDQA